MSETHISGRARNGSTAGESSAPITTRAPSARCQTLPAPADGPPGATFRAPRCQLSPRSERTRSRAATPRRGAYGVENSTSSLRTSLFAYHQPDGARHLAPAAGLAHELFAAFRRQSVELCLAIVFARTPVRRNPLSVFEPMQRGTDPE